MADECLDDWCTMCTGCVAEDCKGRHPFITVNGEIGPHLEIYELFHSVRLREERQNSATKKIQRKWRDFVAKRKLRKIKLMLQEQMGTNYNWSDFVKSYKHLVQRVQGRHGVTKISTKFDFDLDDVLHFLNNQNRLDKVFSELATADGKLSTKKLSEFFQKAGMYPTKREIDSAFKLAFKGCSGTGELMFVMESQENADTFKRQKKVIGDLVGRLDCVTANSVRVGCINTETQWFGLSAFKERNDVISAVEELQYAGTGSSGRLEKSLETMRQVMTSESRKDVSKRIAIVLRSQPTDPETDNSPTKRKASVAKNSDKRRASVAVNPAKRTPLDVVNPASGRPSIAANPASRRPSIAANPAKRTLLDVANPANANRRPSVDANSNSRRPSIVVNPAKGTPLEVVNPANRRPSIVVNPAKRTPSEVVNPANRRRSIEVNSNSRRPSVDVNTDGMLTTGNVNSSSRHRLSVAGSVSSRRRSSINADPPNEETDGDGDDDLSADDLNSKVDPDTDRLIHECQLAKDADIRLIVIDATDANAGRHEGHAINAVLASDEKLVFSASDHRTATKIRNEIMDVVCPDADCTHCRFHGSKTRSSKTIPSEGHLLKQELMEMLFTLYPPREAKVEALRRSTWARPVVDDFEIDTQKLATPRPESASNAGDPTRTNDGLRQVLTSDLEKCLRLVFQARLSREGVLHLPIGESGVENVTDVDRAMQLTTLYIRGNTPEVTTTVM